MLKRKVKKFLSLTLPRKVKTKLFFLGPKRYIQYIIAQRIFRINSHVSWPVHWSSTVSHPHNIIRDAELPFLGHHPGCYIQAMNGIEVGRNVRYGPNVHIISSNHNLLDFNIHVKVNPIKLKDNCWIGSGSIILPGVELGEHVIVAAGSVVTKSFPSNSIIGGVPAKLISSVDAYLGDSNWGNY
jgi:acetyltransferase-like isoleucine patch superfamily enzyme